MDGMSFSRQQIFRRVVFHLSISYQVIELITSSQSVLLTGGGAEGKSTEPGAKARFKPFQILWIALLISRLKNNI